MTPVALTAELVESFSGVFLSPMYDNPQPTPEFHRLGWRLYCSEAELATIVAPREHAKSTAFTHDYILANLLFRTEQLHLQQSANAREWKELSIRQQQAQATERQKVARTEADTLDTLKALMVAAS